MAASAQEAQVPVSKINAQLQAEIAELKASRQRFLSYGNDGGQVDLIGEVAEGQPGAVSAASEDCQPPRFTGITEFS